MFCPKCNSEIPNNPRFCPECGFDLETEAESETANTKKESKPLVKNKIRRTNNKSGSLKQTGPAMLAFLFAILQLTTANMILLAITIMNKDTWSSRQCSQAILVGITPGLVSTLLKVFNIFSNVPVVGPILTSGIGVITAIITAVCVIFGIIAIVNVKDGKDANIPIASKLVENWFA